MNNPTVASMMLAILCLLLAGCIILTWVLRYHWKKYGHNPEVIQKAATIYYTGTIALLILASISLLLYIST